MIHPWKDLDPFLLLLKVLLIYLPCHFLPGETDTIEKQLDKEERFSCEGIEGIGYKKGMLLCGSNIPTINAQLCNHQRKNVRQCTTQIVFERYEHCERNNQELRLILIWWLQFANHMN